MSRQGSEKQRRKKCEAGKDCVCLGKSVKQMFEYFLKELTILESSSDSERIRVLSSASPCLLKLLREIVLNILKGNITLPDSHYQELKTYKKTLLKICNPKVKNRFALLRLFKWKKVLPKVLAAVVAALGGTAVQILEKVAF
jgi:hypothetical protein